MQVPENDKPLGTISIRFCATWKLFYKLSQLFIRK
jgi:hypothetical protein